MSLPGWYPDPAGTPNRFRYWDGKAWSHEVTDCVGTLPTAQQFREANVTSSAVTNAATLCRQGGGQ